MRLTGTPYTDKKKKKTIPDELLLEPELIVLFWVKELTLSRQERFSSSTKTLHFIKQER